MLFKIDMKTTNVSGNVTGHTKWTSWEGEGTR